jgi:chromosome partitioning protein
MKTIEFLNQKGGAGKSTLCQELAVCADLEGKKVAILDHDEQGSITQWGKDRDKENPVIIPVKGKPLSEFIALANEKNYDFVCHRHGRERQPKLIRGDGTGRPMPCAVPCP